MAGLKYIHTITVLVLIDCALFLGLFTGLLSCLSVDEYIAIAKEKHGYNMEQVMTWFSFVVKDGFYSSPIKIFLFLCSVLVFPH